MNAADVQRICGEFSIEVIGKSRYPEPGQTRAPETLLRIGRRYGEGHLRLVLTTLRETANNAVLLDESGLWSASDMIRCRPDVVEQQTSEWLDFWDKTHVGPLQAIAQEAYGVLPVRYLLDGMLLERISERFGPRYFQPDLFDDKRRVA